MFGTPRLDVINCVICDDVRTEILEKETIVGVYNAGITVPFVPWKMSICLWFQVIWSEQGEIQLEISVLNPGNREVGKTSGEARAILQGYQSTLTFRGLIITADMEGTYDIQWRADYGNWQSVRKFPISVYRDPASGS